jgi:hypothetical protein
MRRSQFRIVLVLGIAACRTPPPKAAGQFEVSSVYASLFRPYQWWTYHVAPAGEAGDADDDAATSVVVKCQADRVYPFRGGVTSHVKCNAPPELTNETGAFPVEGVWMANETGLWHVTPGMAPTLDNATLILRAHPDEGNVDPDELTGNDEFAEVDKRDDAWCTTHRQHLDVANHLTLCFAPEGVRSGDYGWKDAQATHETRFELAR